MSRAKVAARPRWQRLSVRAWSLRARLLAGVLVLVAIGLAVTGVTATTLLHGYLLQQIDRQLNVASLALSRAPGQPTNPPSGRTNSQIPTPFIITELDVRGHVTARFGGSVADGGPVPDLAGLTPAKAKLKGSEPFTVPALGGGSSYRVRAVVNPSGSGTTTLAISLDSVTKTVRRLQSVITVVAVLVLMGLAGLGTLVVYLGLRPLMAVEATAEQIADGDLSKRVPDAPPGTEIGRLAHALNGMLAQIEQAFTAREHSEETLRRFVADASHELRTPLTSIRGYAELARKDAFPDEAAERQAIGRIEAEAMRLGRMVDDLLLLAHLDQQRPLHITTVDLRQLAEDAVADARVRDPDRRIVCQAPDRPVYAAADVDGMRQVLDNLLGNALQHTTSDIAVTVRLTATTRQATLEVADQGPGIPADHLEHIFDRFYRADRGRSRAAGGSGLGLSIVRAVTEACGGSVSCRSRPGQGTTFTVIVPTAPIPS